MLKTIKDICKLFLKAGWAALFVLFTMVFETEYGITSYPFTLFEVSSGSETYYVSLTYELLKILAAFFLIGFVGYIATSIVEGVKAEKDKKK